MAAKKVNPKTDKAVSATLKQFPELARKLRDDEHMTLAWILGYTNLGNTVKFEGDMLKVESHQPASLLNHNMMRLALRSSLTAMCESEEMYQGMMEEINDWVRDKELKDYSLARIGNIWSDLWPLLHVWSKANT